MPRIAPAFVGDVVRLSPGRPAWMLGVRTALATMLPLLLTPWIGVEAASWASTGGFTVALADKGGSYRSRALTMGAVTLGAAVAVAVGSLASGAALAAILVMFAWASLCSFTGALGAVMAAAGGTAAVLFAESVDSTVVTWALTGERALAVLASGAWAMTLSLLFWPIRVYRPARYAVAGCFRCLAQQAESLAPHGHGTVREALERARLVLADTRRGRLAESGRGTRLLVLLQIADLMFGTITSLEEVVDAALVSGAPANVADQIERSLSRLAAALRELAARVETERKLPPAPPVDWDADGLRALGGGTASWVGHCQQAGELLARLGEDLRVALATAATLYDDSRPRDLLPDAADAPGGAGTIDERRSAWERLRQELTPESALLRHALRVGVVAALAVVLVRVLKLDEGYYVTLTVLILMQPYTPATFTRTLQRVGGTVLGGIAAALLVRFFHGHAALMVVATLLAGVSAAVLQLNYALFAFFLTPTFVLLAEADAHDPHAVKVRIVNTVLGGVLALAGARLLWPHRERKRFPDEMAHAMAALERHFDELIGSGAAASVVEVRASRRRFGLATNRAEASFQRLLAESRTGGEALEPYMTLLLFARRFAAMIGAAASAQTAADAVETAALARRMGQQLQQLEAAVRSRRLPPPLPPMEALAARVASPVLAARLQRLVLQLTVLHRAVARCGQVSLTRS